MQPNVTYYGRLLWSVEWHVASTVFTCFIWSRDNEVKYIVLLTTSIVKKRTVGLHCLLQLFEVLAYMTLRWLRNGTCSYESPCCQTVKDDQSYTIVHLIVLNTTAYLWKECRRSKIDKYRHISLSICIYWTCSHLLRTDALVSLKLCSSLISYIASNLLK